MSDDLGKSKQTAIVVGSALAGGAIGAGIAHEMVAKKFVEDIFTPDSTLHVLKDAEQPWAGGLTETRHTKLIQEAQSIIDGPRYQEAIKTAAKPHAGTEAEKLVQKQATRAQEALKFLKDASTINGVEFKKIPNSNHYIAAVYPTKESLKGITPEAAEATYLRGIKCDATGVLTDGHYTIHGVLLPETAQLEKVKEGFFRLPAEAVHSIEGNWFDYARNIKITKPLAELNKAGGLLSEVSAFRKASPVGWALKHFAIGNMSRPSRASLWRQPSLAVMRHI